MQITHDREGLRFIAANDDGEVMGEIAYEPNGGILSATHTLTDSRFRGQGIAAKMLDALAGYARENGFKIRPVCSYVVTAFEKKPEQYRDVME